MSKGPILKSETNPDGWKLEDLLPALAAELRGKTDALVARAGEIETDDHRQVHARVSRGNAMVINLLQQCEDVQRQAKAALKRLP